MRHQVIAGLFIAMIAFCVQTATAEETKTLAIGEGAPEFNLPGVYLEAPAPGQERTAKVRNYELKDFAEADILVVAFMSNQCPVATAYEERFIQFANDFRDRGVAVVFISPNAPRPRREGEPVSDRGDSLEEMQVRAVKRGFPFPYLYDGEQQNVTRAFGPLATPHVFIFDKERKLRYSGRVDNSQNPAGVTSQDARTALEALLAGKAVPQETTRAFGCSIKWRKTGGPAR